MKTIKHISRSLASLDEVPDDIKWSRFNNVKKFRQWVAEQDLEGMGAINTFTGIKEDPS